MTDNCKVELTSAAERLYEVFRTYAPPAHPSFCTHCISEADDSVLRSKPLRDLTADDLNKYAFDAVSLWGTAEQFKYLLPRLFELVITECFDCPEVLFKKPQLSHLSSWPETERSALNEYCASLWRYALGLHPLTGHLSSFTNIEPCLCSVAQIVDDLLPLLEFWDSDTRPSASRHLAEFAAENASFLREKKMLSDAFWDERPEQMAQVVHWFMSRDFALTFDVVESSVSPVDFREEVTRAVMNRPRTRK